jgi:flagellar biosynthesis protein FlhA
VSRASAEGNLATELSGQLFRKSAPLLITGGFLLLLGIVPGLPLLPFWGLAAAVLFLGRKRSAEEKQEVQRQIQEAREAERPQPRENTADLLLVDPLELEIGYALISIVDPAQGGDLLERVKMLRQQLAVELGIVIPPVRIRDNVALDANRYIIKLRGNPVAEGEVLPGYHLALIPEELDGAPTGIRVTDPTFGLPAVWIAERNLAEAERTGLTVVEPQAVITTHLLEVLRKVAHNLLDRQEVKKLVDKVKETAPALVEELVPGLLSLGAIQKVLKHLLRERIPVRDLVMILEAMADHAPATKNVDVLTEYARAALAPTITRQFTSEDGRVHAFVLDPILEHHLFEKASSGDLNAGTLGLTPERSEKFAREADRLAKKLIAVGSPPVFLTSPVLRPTLYNFLSPMLTDITVLSYNDLTADAEVEVVDQLKLD